MQCRRLPRDFRRNGTRLYRAILGVVICSLGWSSIVLAQTQPELDYKSGGGLFARMWRTAAVEQVKNPHYPSVVNTGDGGVLLMFTNIPDPSESEPAVLAVSSSVDNGRTWSPPRTAYTAPSGIPKALGTLTRLPPTA